MAAKEIYDYLSAVTADYTTAEFAYDGATQIVPQGVLFTEGGKNVIIHMADDDSEQRIGISSDTRFYVRMQWNLLNESQSGALFDFYHDTAKASGALNSFYWTYSAWLGAEAHTYTVRFTAPLTRLKQMTALWTIPTIRLRVLGKKP